MMNRDRVLSFVRNNPGRTQQEISKALGIPPDTGQQVNHKLLGLMEEGLVKRDEQKRPYKYYPMSASVQTSTELHHTKGKEVIMEQIGRRVEANRHYLEKLVAAPCYRFDDKLHSLLPEKPGIYRIIVTSSQETLRVGTTKSSDSLRQRVYRNHLMGNQSGNIRSQLVKSGRCKDLDAAKSYLQSLCSVQWTVIEDKEDRKWAEHFVLAVLQPVFSY